MKDELSDPWGLLLAAVAGGVAWAVRVPVLAAIVIGVSVWLVRAGISAVQRRRAVTGPVSAPELPVDPDSTEGTWLRRAVEADRSLKSLTAAMPRGPLADQVARMEARLDETVDSLRRLAGHATTTGRALDRFDPSFLAAERRRLTEAIQQAGQQSATTSGADLVPEYERSLASIQAQQEVYGRLAAARGKALARLESGTLGLEGLVARVVELSAMAAGDLGGGLGEGGPAGGTEATAALDELAGELDGIRAGLAEAEEITRQALGAYRSG